MIISASRNTDIPAYYGKWLINGISRGYVDIPNPDKKTKTTYVRVPLTPNVVDCMVLWTRNAVPFLEYMEDLNKSGLFYTFQYAITPYDNIMEPDQPGKLALMKSFSAISEIIGKERITWRYAPIVYTNNMDNSFHTKMFEWFAKRLKGKTDKVVVSFDESKMTQSQSAYTGKIDVPFSKRAELIKAMTETAAVNDMKIKVCCDNTRVISDRGCIDPDEIASLLGAAFHSFAKTRDTNGCICADTVDIGVQGTCQMGCAFCMGKMELHNAKALYEKHDPELPTMFIPGNDYYLRPVIELKAKSNVSYQMTLFE